jgi:hypothetical protein
MTKPLKRSVPSEAKERTKGQIDPLIESSRLAFNLRYRRGSEGYNCPHQERSTYDMGRGQVIGDEHEAPLS